MCNANGNALNLKFFGIDVTVMFFVLVAGAKEISALGIVEAEDFQVVESPIKCNFAISAKNSPLPTKDSGMRMYSMICSVSS